jgi:hypothetical protein
MNSYLWRLDHIYGDLKTLVSEKAGWVGVD